jgi:hypothetical protein
VQGTVPDLFPFQEVKKDGQVIAVSVYEDIAHEGSEGVTPECAFRLQEPWLSEYHRLVELPSASFFVYESF